MRPRILSIFAVMMATNVFTVGGLHAQPYPTKPIRIVVGFAPGGGADVTARMLAPKLAESLGQPAIVENRPGASTAIALERVATSPPDGYTLLVMSSSSTILPALRPNLPYDIERDFAAVSLLSTGQFVLVVHPSVPARTVKALIALSRAQPGKLSYGSSGVGSASHLAAELFKSLAKVDLVHVPYKGANEAAIATASGQIEVFFPSIAPLLPLLAAAKLRPLAVTGAQRTPLMAGMPTISESGLPGYDRSTWYGVLGPAAVPKAVIARLNSVIAKEFNTREIKDALNSQGLEPATDTPEHFAAFVRNDIAQNVKLIKLSGAKAE